MNNLDCKKIRKNILDMAYSGQTVHIGCAFSIVELVKVVYQNWILSDGYKFEENKNFFVLSKGHGVMALYSLFKEVGWISHKQVEQYYKDNTLLKGLSDSHVPGLEVTSGSLGHGFSIAVGMAHAEKIKKTNKQIFCLVGDGESNEGAIWEGLLYASHWKLDNLVVIFDCNDFQAMGSTQEIMNLGLLELKTQTFGFETLIVDGHSEIEIQKSINQLTQASNDKPKALIAKTIKGKGVSFMEANNLWHYTRLTDETYKNALNELGC